MNELFFYDDDLNIYISKSTGNVQYLEAKIFMKKILLFILILCLGLINIVTLMMKLTG